MIQVNGVETLGDRAVADVVIAAVETFLKRGVQNIERKANEVRMSLIAKLEKQDPNADYDSINLPGTSVKQALVELGPTFHLLEPKHVIVEICRGRSPVHEGRSMEALPGKILVYPDVIDVTNMSAHGLSAREVTFHEMFHVCGETQHDGVIRYNHVGIRAVTE